MLLLAVEHVNQHFMERLEIHLWFDRHAGALIVTFEVDWFQNVSSAVLMLQ